MRKKLQKNFLFILVVPKIIPAKQKIKEIKAICSTDFYSKSDAFKKIE